MKSRPRRIENRVAEEMSKFYESINMSPVVRIPILGRAGPDISLNELNLAIDVKSRKSCPKLIRPKPGFVSYAPDWAWHAVRLDEIDLLLQRTARLQQIKRSKMIQDWLDHMDEWSVEQDEHIISGLVIHRPGEQVKAAILVIKQWEVFRDRTIGYE